ncbi:uncharacterized protein L969DRAFT_55743, partial [Mixia osmundae IAM 14324]|uniref:uncharacterized protein n=1 Tax=Mixia osmundae (strain CBS 9802 / IAM 14324 / JCM 22182 / KY 12970) TaxID=764103 RepID=UPI0004A5523C
VPRSASAIGLRTLALDYRCQATDIACSGWFLVTWPTLHVKEVCISIASCLPSSTAGWALASQSILKSRPRLRIDRLLQASDGTGKPSSNSPSFRPVDISLANLDGKSICTLSCNGHQQQMRLKRR